MHLEEMLEYNKQFVEGKSYEPYKTDSIPNKRMVIFTCMESRLVELLPRALNIQNGDVKMLKNAGAIIRKPFDSIMKSILVAVYQLQAEEVTVIGHHDCGMSHVDT
ncbi:carbonic anhydrase, partial [Virgibacillus halodenitrificans]|nr:carbonic anhydrase [Virgibacillus halodenitrificans]